MTVNGHLRNVWRHRRAIVVAAVAAAVAVYLLLSVLVSKVYEANAELSVSVPIGASGQIADQATVLFATSTVAQLARTTPVLSAAAAASGLGIDRQRVASLTTVTPSQTVGSITLSANGPSPAAAETLARSLTTAIIDADRSQQSSATAAALAPISRQLAALKAQIAALPAGSPSLAADQSELQVLTQQLAQADIQAQPQLAVASPADASATPVSPKVRTDALLAFLITLIVAAEAGAFWSFVHDGFAIDDVEDDIRRTLRLPVLASVPSRPEEAVDEAFRELRTNLIFLNGPAPTRTVAVVGVERGVGRTFCAIHLARAVGDMQANAGLIDADLRVRAMADALSLPQVPGLTDGLTNSAGLRTHRLDGSGGVSVLTAGHAVADPAGLVGAWITPVIFPLFAHMDLVLVDTPATASHPDALAIAPLCDATLLVIDPRLSRRRACVRLLEQLQRVGANPVGVVVNRSAADGRAGRRRRSERPAPPWTAARRGPGGSLTDGQGAGPAELDVPASSNGVAVTGPERNGDTPDGRQPAGR